MNGKVLRHLPSDEQESESADQMMDFSERMFKEDRSDGLPLASM